MSDWRKDAEPADWKADAEPVETTEPTFHEKVQSFLDRRPTPGQSPGDEAREAVRAMLGPATFGFAPKLVEASGEAAPGEASKQYQQAEERFPAHAFLGTLLQPIPGANLKGVAGAAARIGANALAGGVTNYNQTQDSAPGDFLTGALAGGVGAGTGEVLAPILKKVAGTLFTKAIGPKAGIVNRLAQEGFKPGEVSDFGHAANDMGLIPVLGGKEAIAKRAGQKASEIWKETDPIVRDFNRATGGNYDFPATEAAARPFNLTTVAERAAGPARQFAEDIGQESGGLDRMLQAKADAYRSPQFSPDAAHRSLQKEIFTRSVGQARGDMQRQIAQHLGTPAAQKMADIGERYGIAATTRDLASEAATRGALHQNFNPLEILTAGAAGGSAAAVGEPLFKAALGRADAVTGHLANKSSELAPAFGRAAGRTGQSFADWLKDKHEEAKDKMEGE